MLIRMLRARAWQDAGRERMLTIGETVDLPEALAVVFVAAGAAAFAVPAARERAVTTVPETKRGR